MREIKFRAWDKLDKKMEIVTEIDFLTEKALVGFYMGEQQYKKIPERIELMQYTGAKDTNGKQIYEGDILGDNEGCSTGEVYFCKKCASYSVRECNGPLWDLFDFLNLPNIEIVGNIYENPELLTKTDDK